MIGEIFDLRSWVELRDALATSPSAIIVVDPHWGGALALRELRALRDQPGLSDVVIYGTFAGRSTPHDVRMLLQEGFSRIRSLGYDDSPTRLAEDLLDSVGLRQLERVVSGLEPALTDRQRLILRWAMRRGCRPISVEDLAFDLGVSTRSVRRWCAHHGDLTASRLLQWARLLHACRVVGESRLPPSAAVQQLHFSSYSSFCRLYKRLVGTSCAGQPRQDLFVSASDAFGRIVLESAS